MPVTTPLFTVAIPGALVDQTPPAVVELKVVVEPTQTLVFPVNAATVGNAFTVINFVAVVEQPLAVTVYLISAVPFDTPVTTPLEFTVAIPVALLVQTPPAVVLLNIVVDPTHTEVAPVVAATIGKAFTVINFVTVLEHPLIVTVYDIVEVPGLAPIITPFALIGAMFGSPLNQTPPVVVDECTCDGCYGW